MKAETVTWSTERGWVDEPPTLDDADLVFLFGNLNELRTEQNEVASLLETHDGPAIGCSTAGEINGASVHDDTLVITTLSFDDVSVRSGSVPLPEAGRSREAGRELGKELQADDLTHVLVLSEGLNVNGTQLLDGLESVLPETSITGGLAGDSDRFHETLIFDGDCVETGLVAGVGFYGSSLRIGCGSAGGWSPYGPEWTVTASDGQLLQELDGEPALSVYKSYMGSRSDDLPASGLLFPLAVKLYDDSEDVRVTRTLLDVNEEDSTIKLAGNIPNGSRVQLMKANFQGLLEGARSSAQAAKDSSGQQPPDYTVAVSCVGRKLIMKQRSSEEIEAVREVLGEETVLSGFYAYGEISPNGASRRCELHNQSMTLTTFRETD